MFAQNISTEIMHHENVEEGQDKLSSSQPPPSGRQFRLLHLNKAWLPWYISLKQILPIYVAAHIAILVIDVLSVLFRVPDLSSQALPIRTLVDAWNRWDTQHFVFIAQHGYTEWWRTAFFPLYPLLIREVSLLTGNAVIAGLLISNIASLFMFVALHRIVTEDFGQERADRTVLYLTVFPSAFFLTAAYTESLFLCFMFFGFYHIRRGHWWQAGICGLLASLTRSVGVLFIVLFLYEYIRQRNFQLKMMRADILAVALIPLGTLIFAAYCYLRFHDPLSFSHAQTVIWNRNFHFPWEGLVHAFQVMPTFGVLSFRFLRNLLEVGGSLFTLTLIVLSFVGPWRFPRKLLVYNLYAIIFYLYFHSFPILNLHPMESITRYMVEIFPAFIVLSTIGGKSRYIHFNYLMVAGSIFCFLLIQFLTGHWIT